MNTHPYDDYDDYSSDEEHQNTNLTRKKKKDFNELKDRLNATQRRHELLLVENVTLVQANTNLKTKLDALETKLYEIYSLFS
jgi:hypothetical protein